MMKTLREALIVVFVAAAGGGCAGDGTGLDEFGNPLTEPSAVPAPTLTAIQRGVFTAICTQCHTGSSAPLGMPLDAGLARSNLVGVSSAQLPGLLRVRPGRPDSSYLVWKIEGRAGIVGSRMPLGQQPLSDAWIAAIRGWVEAGAPAN